MKFKVRLYAFSGEGLPAKDSDGLSDPFLRINFDAFKKCDSEVVKNNVNPVWSFDLPFVYETRFGHKLKSKSLVIEVWDKNKYTSSVYMCTCNVDLQTLAAGPVAHDLQLWAESKPAGRLKFNCEMEQLADVTVFFKGIGISNLPQCEGAPPNTSLHFSYSGTSTAVSPTGVTTPIPKIKLQSERKVNNANPEWGALEQMRVCATLRELWNERFEFEILHHPRGGKHPVPIGTVALPINKFVAFVDGTELKFDEPVELHQDFVNAGAAIPRIEGIVYYRDFPIFAQMRGGVHKENGIFDGSIFAPGLQLPGVSIDAEKKAAPVQPSSAPSSSPSASTPNMFSDPASGASPAASAPVSAPTPAATAPAPAPAPAALGGGGFGGFGGGGLFGEMVVMSEHSQHVWDSGNNATAQPPQVAAPAPVPSPQPVARGSFGAPQPGRPSANGIAVSTAPITGPVPVTPSPPPQQPSNLLMVPSPMANTPGGMGGPLRAFPPSPSHSPTASPLLMPPGMNLAPPSSVPLMPPSSPSMMPMAIPTSSMLPLPSSSPPPVRTPPSYPTSSGQSALAPPVSSSPVQPSDEWACIDCTLLNKWGVSACGACGRKAPPPATPPPAPVVPATSPISYPVMTPTGPNGALVPTGPGPVHHHGHSGSMGGGFNPPVPPSTGHYIPPSPVATAPPMTPTGPNGQLVPTGPNAPPASSIPMFTPTGPNGALVPTGPNTPSSSAPVYTPTGPNGGLVPTGPNAGPGLFGDMVALATGHPMSPASSAPIPGKAGICVACSKPADFICSQTKVPVCGKECKMSNLRAHGIAPLPAVQPPQPQPVMPPQHIPSHYPMPATNFPPAPAPLPAGWIEAVDPTSGRIYYKDSVNKTTSWERPTAPAGPAAAPILHAAPLDFSANALPVGWSEAVDPASGRKYYKNHYTKVTTWERPVAAGHGGIIGQQSGYNTLFEIAAQTGGVGINTNPQSGYGGAHGAAALSPHK